MQKFTLKAKIRDSKATPAALRSEGLVPCELYGNKVENLHLVASRSELEKLYKKAGATSIVEVEIEGVGVRSVLLHDLQHHYLKGHLTHADFYQVNLTEKIKAFIPLVFVGESKIMREEGGVLVKLINEVEVESLPQNLPHELSVDLSKLATFEDTILVSDIVVPDSVELLTDKDETVANVQPARDLEAELSAPIESISAADVEVEKKGKKDEDTEEAK